MVVVCREGIDVSGNFHRNKLKYLDFLQKLMNTKLSGGSYHLWALAVFGWHIVWGMLPHKTNRRLAALECLKVLDWDPSALWREAGGGPCCPQGCVAEVCEQVCLPGASGWRGLVEVPGDDSHSGGEAEGEGHDALREEAALEATDIGRKEYAEASQQVHWGPQD